MRLFLIPAMLFMAFHPGLICFAWQDAVDVANDMSKRRQAITTEIVDPPLVITDEGQAILANDPSYRNELIFKHMIPADIGDSIRFQATGNDGLGTSEGLRFDWIIFRASNGAIVQRLQGDVIQFLPSHADLYFVKCQAREMGGAWDPLGDMRIVTTARRITAEIAITISPNDPLTAEFAVDEIEGLDDNHVESWLWSLIHEDQGVVAEGSGETWSHTFDALGNHAARLAVVIAPSYRAAYLNPGFSLISRTLAVQEDGLAVGRPYPYDGSFQVGEHINRSPMDGVGEYIFETVVQSLARVPFPGVERLEQPQWMTGPYTLSGLENMGGYQVLFGERTSSSSYKRQKFNESVTIRSEHIYQDDVELVATSTKGSLLPLMQGRFSDWILDHPKAFAFQHDGLARADLFFSCDAPFDLWVIPPGSSHTATQVTGVTGYTVQLGTADLPGQYIIQITPAMSLSGGAR